MRIDFSPDCRELVLRQSGVITRRQAVACGISTDTIENQLRADRWQRLHTGVYATSSGEPSRDAWLWAAVLRAGADATLSHQTAADLHGMADRPSEIIHVSVPANRHPAPMPGVRVHRLHRLESVRHPVLLPPRTRAEDTALDLAQAAASFDDAFGWLARAVGRRLTTAGRLQISLAARPKVRWRTDLTIALGDIRFGVLSCLEHRYVRQVERPHGLPAARRQAKVVQDQRVKYVDNLYEAAGLAVELDGRVAHSIEERWSDVHRDNAHATAGLLTLRYSWADVTTRACLVAEQVAGVLRWRGTPVRPRCCRPGCPAGLLDAR